MNPKQKIVLWIGIFIIVVMGVFPPWIIPNVSDPSTGYYAAGYHFFLMPPDAGSISSRYKMAGISTRCRMDFMRLYSQWIVVAVVTGGLLATFKDKKKDSQCSNSNG